MLYIFFDYSSYVCYGVNSSLLSLYLYALTRSMTQLLLLARCSSAFIFGKKGFVRLGYVSVAGDFVVGDIFGRWRDVSASLVTFGSADDLLTSIF